jgi:hypothetical protein
LLVTDPLGIYLQDHLAGATFGLELAERCRRNNEGTPFGGELRALSAEIRGDRETLTDVMQELGARPSRPKVWAAWAFEKVQRLKPNGHLVGYTPLGRVEELESLAIGIAGKRALWQLLEQLADAGLPTSRDYGALAQRADTQLRRVEALRVEAGEEAFVSGTPSRTTPQPKTRLPRRRYPTT